VATLFFHVTTLALLAEVGFLIAALFTFWNTLLSFWQYFLPSRRVLVLMILYLISFLCAGFAVFIPFLNPASLLLRSLANAGFTLFLVESFLMQVF
jgi:hypothetical protein